MDQVRILAGFSAYPGLDLDILFGEQCSGEHAGEGSAQRQFDSHS